MKLNLILNLVLGALAVIPATHAQTYTVLKHLAALEASNPQAGLTLFDGTLYGTTRLGGNGGTVFKMGTNGTGFRVIKSFSLNEGTFPQSVLVLSGNTLFGTTATGGTNSQGVVFRVNTDGTGFAVLKHFSGLLEDGGNPHAGLVVSGSTLFGTTINGGAGARGTVFKLETNGTGFAVLHHFAAISSSDGSTPEAGLLLSGNTLYGTTYAGGSDSRGTVFKLNTDGSGYAILRSFRRFVSDGESPNAGLLLSGATLYGTTQRGGNSGSGAVYKMNVDGAGYAVLKSFNNTDGSNPRAGLVLSGDTLYGTTDTGGNSGLGVLFMVNTDGTGFSVLKHFNTADGSNPRADLVISGRTLYGTTYLGGSSSFYGTVFSYSIPPAAPVLSGELLFSGGNILLFARGSAGANYALERTLSLSTPAWLPQITNIADANGMLSFTNATSPASNNFWRIRAVP